MSMTDIEFLNEMFPYYEDMTDLEVLQTASRRVGAEKMAKWKDEQMIEKAVDRGYLTDWYQSSVDETQEPIWTDKHLDELYGDFYLIPKQIMKE